MERNDKVRFDGRQKSLVSLQILKQNELKQIEKGQPKDHDRKIQIRYLNGHADSVQLTFGKESQQNSLEINVPGSENRQAHGRDNLLHIKQHVGMPHLKIDRGQSSNKGHVNQFRSLKQLVNTTAPEGGKVTQGEWKDHENHRNSDRKFRADRENQLQEMETHHRSQRLEKQAEIERLEREKKLRHHEEVVRQQFLRLAHQDETEKQNALKSEANRIRAWKLLRSITNNRDSDTNEWLSFASIVEKESDNYQKILSYITNSQEHSFRVSVKNIIRIVRKNENVLPSNSLVRNRMMLWHGTKMNVVGSILREGFKCPLQRGGMFGTGIYFADRFSKSAQYCDNNDRGSIGYLFLCDVELGMIHEALNAIASLTNAPNNCNSVKGVGKTIPDINYNQYIEGSLLACGPSVNNFEVPNCSLNFNEYAVYQPERIIPRFLVIVEFL